MRHVPEHSICAVCFSVFPLSYAQTEYPMCPDCGSEGLDFPLEPLEDFLKQVSLPRLRALREQWNAATGFRESYKNAKRERIERVIAMKEQSVA